MAHLTPRSGYRELVERINLSSQGAHPSELLNRILALLFQEREAALVARLPLRPFTAAQAARVWNVGEADAVRTLTLLADRAMLVDVELKGEMRYVLPPPMAGFFEFALMRVRDDLDQRLLSELYEQYISVEEEFIKGLAVGGPTQQGRILVHEPVLSGEHALEVLDFERASHLIESADAVAVGLCYCRHKRRHQGRACSAPLDNCLTLNMVAKSLIRHGNAREVGRAEALDILHRSREANLAQFGENVRQGVNFLCNCCPCCCEAMLSHRRFGHLHPIHTSNFLVAVRENCTGCGRCLPVCPARALTLETDRPQGRGSKKAAADGERCLGCGVCVRNCPRSALAMEPRPSRVLTPVNSVHKTVLMAIERGKLQNLVFDHQVLWSHRALAAVLGAILKLPPVKRALAGSQLGSRYLEGLCERFPLG